MATIATPKVLAELTEDEQAEALKTAENVNNTKVDLTGKGDYEDQKNKGHSAPPPTTPTPTPTPVAGGTPPPAPTPPAPGAGPGPGSPGGGGGSGSGNSSKDVPSKNDSKVRGIESSGAKDVDFTNNKAWLFDGGVPTWAQIKESTKYKEYLPVGKEMNKALKKIRIEEIQEKEHGFIIGKKLNVGHYAQGKEKYFSKIITPSRDDLELNIIFALDLSGSMGEDKAAQASAVMWHVIRSLEDNKIMHSTMMYDTEVGLLTVDNKGRDKVHNILMGTIHGRGGNDEIVVLNTAYEIAKRNKDRKNVVIFLSDGGVSDISDDLENFKKDFRGMNGIEVYCFGYGNGFDEEYAGKIFGEKVTFASMKPKELATQLTKVIKKEYDSVSKEAQ